jgi:formamidopyrimidine-DNA glycosylase
MDFMPELPEVETIARDLRARVVGKTISRIWTSGKPLRMARAIDVEALHRISMGQTVAGIRRVGKYLLVDMAPRAHAAGAGGSPGVLIHLGMSGRLQIEAATAPRLAHTHVVFELADGSELRFRDPRRFGWIAAADPVDSCVELQSMGPDPLGAFTAEMLSRSLAGVRAPIKAFLLDQSRVAGLGNIYVCEALFRARIHPTAPASRVSGRAAALLTGIEQALRQGIANRGTTLRDYVDSFGSGGNNAQALLVYGRMDEPCTVCGAPIRRRVHSARSTFYCGRCQRW